MHVSPGQFRLELKAMNILTAWFSVKVVPPASLIALVLAAAVSSPVCACETVFKPTNPSAQPFAAMLHNIV